MTTKFEEEEDDDEDDGEEEKRVTKERERMECEERQRQDSEAENSLIHRGSSSGKKFYCKRLRGRGGRERKSEEAHVLSMKLTT